MEEVVEHDFRLVVSDPEALAEAIRGSRIDACLLRGNPGCSHLERVHLPHSCFDTALLSSPMLMSGRMAEECHTLIYVTECPRNGHSFNFAMEHGSGYMGLFAPGGSLDAMTPAGYANATLTIPVDWFRKEMSHRFPDMPDGWLRGGHGFRVDETSRRRIAGILEGRSEMARSDPDWMAAPASRMAFEEELVECYVDALHGSHKPGRRVSSAPCLRRYGALRRIRDHIAANRNSPIRLGDLCLASGMSRRGLEYLFKDVFGTGVNAFVRCQRLHGARRAILASGSEPGCVKRIALDWGFWHLGRFAAQYRGLFGESPSETAARHHS